MSVKAVSVLTPNEVVTNLGQEIEAFKPLAPLGRPCGPVEFYLAVGVYNGPLEFATGR